MNTEELSQLIEQYGNILYGFCCQLTGSQQQAEDLYQNTFLTAMERLDKIRRDTNPKSFLAGIAIRLWKNQRREENRRQSLAPSQCLDDTFSLACPAEEESEAQLLSKERILAVRHAVWQLEPRLRLPVTLYYTARFSIPEIVKTLKIPSSTIKSRLHKARALLKKQGKKYYELQILFIFFNPSIACYGSRRRSHPFRHCFCRMAFSVSS